MDVVDKIKAGTEANNGQVTNPDKIVTHAHGGRIEIIRSLQGMSTGNTLTLETTRGPVVIEMNPNPRAGSRRPYQEARLRGLL